MYSKKAVMENDVDDRILVKALSVDGELVVGLYARRYKVEKNKETQEVLSVSYTDVVLVEDYADTGALVNVREVEVNPDTIREAVGVRDVNGQLLFIDDVVEMVGDQGKQEDGSVWTIKYNPSDLGYTLDRYKLTKNKEVRYVRSELEGS